MKMAVVGAGTMGSGIAQVAAFHGHQVRLHDTAARHLDRGLESIRKSLRRVVDKLEEERHEKTFEETLSRVHPVLERDALADSDFVVEAVFESFEAKRSVFEWLDQLCRPETILASNTSSISITRLAAVTKRADRVIGMHFMNPVPVMRLVEIIRGLETSQQVWETTRDLARRLDKTPVEVRDFPGFVSNRVLLPMLNEAMFAVMEGVARPEDVDEVMRLGMNHPMGPLQLADFIGLDVCLDILNVLYEGFRDPKYRPCPLLRQMVDAGWLGRKSGRGFYEYPKR